MDDGLARLIVATVTTAFERARAGTVPRTDALASAQKDASRTATRPEELMALVGVATERSARYGWGFTLVLIRVDDPESDTARRIETHLRASDTLIELAASDLALLLPAASDEQVPLILGRVGQGGAVSTFCYGLATCPVDTADPADLLALAAARLRDAEATRGTPEIHVLEPPTA
jgi:hypothetical protein